MSFNSPFTGNVIQPTDVSFRAITLSADSQLEWPINGSPTDNPAARIMNVTATAGGLKLKMPPANQASVGQDALIRNVGGTTFTVTDYDGNTIISVTAGQAKYIYITTNATTAGTWGNIAFGVGTSNADAATLAGYGLKAIASTLNQAYSVTTFSSNYTALASDRASSYLWTGGAGTLTLTAPTTIGNDWFMMLRNGGTGTLTVSPASGLINGASSISLQPADSAFIVCSGATYFTVGLGKTSQFNFTQLTKAVVSGNYTLSSAEAANVVQKYTGTLSGNVTVILPPTIQVYYISNQTDGTGAGYSITFTTNIAGSGTATIPAGQQAILVCDSVNMLNASTVLAGTTSISLGDGTAGSPALNFSAETNTGIYRPSTNQFGISVNGTQRLRATNAGVVITGTGTFSLGVSGGTF
jgi:hypothetical protein